MGLVADAVAVLGGSSNDYRNMLIFGDDFESMWQKQWCGRFSAWLLRRIGFEWERVSSVVFDALEDERLRIEANKFVGGFRTPEAAHTLVHFLCDLLEGIRGARCGCDTDQAVADVYRQKFPWDEVKPKLLEAMA